MPAQPVSEPRHHHQHHREDPLVAGSEPEIQQQRIGRFIDGKAAGRDREEAQRGSAERRAASAKSQPMMTTERKQECTQPPDHIGRQWSPSTMTDQQHDHAPMHRRGDAADEQEPGEVAVMSGRDVGFHAGPKHSGVAVPVLCVCVDDFGLSPGIAEAVFRLARQGVVRATSCMVGAPLWRAHGARLREWSWLEAGLHLDFTEHPLDGAARRSLAALIAASYAGMLDAARVRREVSAQFDAFEAVMGRAPDFIDGHQHVHQLPVIRSALMAEVESRYRGGQKKPWLRSTRRARCTAVGPSERFKASFIEQIGAKELSALASRAGLIQNRHLLGVYDFSGGPNRYEALLQTWIGTAAPRDLLMCHPSAEADPSDALATARRAEFEVLSRPGFVAELLDGAGLQPGLISSC